MGKRVLYLFVVLAVALLSGCDKNVSSTGCVDSLMPNVKEGTEVAEYLAVLSDTALFGDKDVDGSFCYQYEWYKDHMSSRMLGSRGIATLIIILGAIIPLLGVINLEQSRHKFWVAFLGAAIVVSQGFFQTFQYEESWRYYTQAKTQLEKARNTWQLEVIEASLLETGGLNQAQLATEAFSETTSKIVQNETVSFFDSMTSAIAQEQR